MARNPNKTESQYFDCVIIEAYYRKKRALNQPYTEVSDTLLIWPTSQETVEPDGSISYFLASATNECDQQRDGMKIALVSYREYLLFHRLCLKRNYPRDILIQ
ncbi:hypothetical protein D8B26_003602 [Coccidioides posadasii str. Silveira]|uniref:uncharacterized protein n=1 Tax=Coccidioides posadasii (strain RMSCC 757 / Silveira) TaxID=443226 RepID=UPI001BF0BB1D|nr:hypothetical protein D8B26_003602 [Coccidioides posadasii str. Silveira]